MSEIQTGLNREGLPLPLNVWSISWDVMKTVLVKLWGNRHCPMLLLGGEGGSAIFIEMTNAHAL